MSAPTQKVLVAGCGFIGRALARRLASSGWEVFGGTSSQASAEALAGESFRAVWCDMSDRDSVERMRADLPPLDAVVHCASSGRGGVDAYRAVYLEGSRNLLAVLQPGYFLFTGSTSVYAQTDGAWVTEESSAEPDRETGRILREAEMVALATGGGVARLGGIYGPGRSVLLKKFFSGEAVIEDGGARWINQVHRDDAASALAALVEAKAAGIFNVSDGSPIAQLDLYTRLSERFERPLPPPAPADYARKRGWTHKRVSNSKLRGIGWEAKYPSFFDAVEHDPELVPAAMNPS